jgi:hypothetical protein
VDIAPQAGLDDYDRTWSADVADFNGNGRDDFIYIPHDPQAPSRGEKMPKPILYRARADGIFREAPIWYPPGRDRHMCIWGDIDLDADLDLFCTVGLTAASENELRKQKDDGSFSLDKSLAYGLQENTYGRYRTATFIHANDDAYPDIYVTRYFGSSNTIDDPSAPDPYPNELWINDGGTGFHRDAAFGLDKRVGALKEVKVCAQAYTSRLTGLEPAHDIPERELDYNNDGLQDLMVCGSTGLKVYKHTVSDSVPAQHSFVPVQKNLAVTGIWRDAEMADFNGDGRLDLVRVNANKVEVKLWTPGIGGFRTLAYENVFPVEDRSGQDLATGDFNGDGLRDVYVVRNCPRTHVARDDGDLVLLGDGLGGFSELTMPRQKCGNTVSPIQYDADPALELIVLNGHREVAGPTQLFDWMETVQAP